MPKRKEDDAMIEEVDKKDSVEPKLDEKKITVKIVYKPPAENIPVVEGNPDFHYGWWIPKLDHNQLIREGWTKVQPDEIDDIPLTVERASDCLRIEGTDLCLYKIPKRILEKIRADRTRSYKERLKGVDIKMMKKDEL